MKTTLHRLFVPVLLLTLMITGGHISGKEPVVKVRFANPVYNNTTKTYRVDVEFQSDAPGLQLFGMNVRFLYDDDALEFQSFGNFRGKYGVHGSPAVITGSKESGNHFGFTGPMEFVNGAIQLKSRSNPVPLTTDQWTKVFTAYFNVENPDAFLREKKSPDLVWDLQSNPENGGFFKGDEGVVITAMSPDKNMESQAVLEQVVNLSANTESGNLLVEGATENLDSFGISVWPNPTKGPVNIDLPWKDIRELDVKVINVLGQQIYRKLYQSGQRITFDLAGNATGMYQVEIYIGEEKYIQKLVLDKK